MLLREKTYYSVRTENDETISQHLAVTSFQQLSVGLSCSVTEKCEAGLHQSSSSVQSWKSHTDNDFPEERGRRCSTVLTLDSVCVSLHPVSKKTLKRRAKLKPKYSRKRLILFQKDSCFRTTQYFCHSMSFTLCCITYYKT